MHELSIALSLLELAEEESARRDHANVVAMHVRIGPLSGVVRESLLSAYDLARENTSLSACRLEIEEVPIVIYCPQCRTEQSAQSMQMLCCSLCGTPAQRVVSGRELELVSLEIEA